MNLTHKVVLNTQYIIIKIQVITQSKTLNKKTRPLQVKKIDVDNKDRPLKQVSLIILQMIISLHKNSPSLIRLQVMNLA